VEIQKEVPLLKGIKNGEFFYFVHSYYVVPEKKEWIGTTTHHGIVFTSCIWKDNIFATQFHPEKSQDKGLKILETFAESI
jgi:glutamine amidotransferase